MPLLAFFLARFFEPSSYAGIGVTTAAVQNMISHGPTAGLIGAALGGIAAFLVPENSAPTPSKPS